MKRIFIAGLIATTALTSAARADIIPTLSSIDPAGSNFSWNYAANVTTDQRVQGTDFFTIYDFGSIVAGSNVQPTGWTFSTSLTGVTPAQIAPNDDPNVLNLTWTYNGTGQIGGPAPLGTFSVLTTTNQARSDDFAAQGTRSGGPDIGTKVNNVGVVSVPVPEMSALAPMIGICGLGLIGFVNSYLRKRRLS
jgi:hypothetical protein